MPKGIIGASFHHDVSYSNNTLKFLLNCYDLDQKTPGSCDLPMWGKVTDEGNIEFKHLAGVLKVNLVNIPAGYNQLIVEASNAIKGNFFTADTSQEYPVLSGSSDSEAMKKVNINFTESTGEANNNTTLYLPLPVGDYEYIYISISNGTDTKILKKWTNKTVARAQVYATTADIDTYVTTADQLVTAVAAENTTIVNLGADITMSDILVLGKKITLNGNGYTLTSSANRAINVNCADEVIIKDLTIATTASNNYSIDTRAINVIQKAAKLTLMNVKAEGFKYTINVAASSEGSTISINGGKYSGYAAMNITGNGTTVTAKDAEFIGANNASYSDTNDFGVICIGDGTTTDVTVTIDGGKLTATSANNNPQAAVHVINTRNTTITVNAELDLHNNNVLFATNYTNFVAKFKSEYEEELEAQGFSVTTDNDMILVPYIKAWDGSTVIQVADTDASAGKVLYEVATADQLAWVLRTWNGDVTSASRPTTIKLLNDIDFGGHEIYFGIETSISFHCITLDGNNHTIKNYKVAGVTTGGSGYKAGLFPQTSGVTIKDLTIDNAIIGSSQTAVDLYAGALIGIATDQKPTPYTTIIENVTVQNSSISGVNKVGGLIGQANGIHTVSDAEVMNTTITGYGADAGSLGGLYGYLKVEGESSFTNCKMTGGSIVCEDGADKASRGSSGFIGTLGMSMTSSSLTLTGCDVSESTDLTKSNTQTPKHELFGAVRSGTAATLTIEGSSITY